MRFLEFFINVNDTTHAERKGGGGYYFNGMHKITSNPHVSALGSSGSDDSDSAAANRQLELSPRRTLAISVLPASLS